MKWNLETREIKSLHENTHNPRYISKESFSQLEKSLDKFGQCEPVVIQPDGSIIGGHQRKKALEKSGARYIDVYVPEKPLSDTDARELSIRLNKNTGNWDFDILANSYEINDLLASGFTPEELHLDLVEENEEKKEKKSKEKKFKIIINFDTEEDLRRVETMLEVGITPYKFTSIEIVA